MKLDLSLSKDGVKGKSKLEVSHGHSKQSATILQEEEIGKHGSIENHGIDNGTSLKKIGKEYFAHDAQASWRVFQHKFGDARNGVLT